MILFQETFNQAFWDKIFLFNKLLECDNKIFTKCLLSLQTFEYQILLNLDIFQLFSHFFYTIWILCFLKNIIFKLYKNLIFFLYANKFFYLLFKKLIIFSITCIFIIKCIYFYKIYFRCQSIYSTQLIKKILLNFFFYNLFFFISNKDKISAHDLCEIFLINWKLKPSIILRFIICNQNIEIMFIFIFYFLQIIFDSELGF